MQVLCVDIDILLLLLLIRSLQLPPRRSREPKTAPAAAYRFTVAATAVAYSERADRDYIVCRNGNVNRQTADDYVEFLGIHSSTIMGTAFDTYILYLYTNIYIYAEYLYILAV